MKLIDIILLIVLITGAIQGYRSGFIVEFFSLLGVILGILGGFKLMGIVMVMLDDRFNINEKVLPYVAFGVVFVIIAILVAVVGNMLKASVSKTALGPVDGFVGAMVGLVRSAFMISVLIWIADAFKFSVLNQWGKDTVVYPALARFAPKITEWLGHVIPFFRDVL